MTLQNTALVLSVISKQILKTVFYHFDKNILLSSMMLYFDNTERFFFIIAYYLNMRNLSYIRYFTDQFIIFLMPANILYVKFKFYFIHQK